MRETETMRISKYDKDELESRIGTRGLVSVNSANRALVQNWLVSQGFPAAWAKDQRLSVLSRAYNDDSYMANLERLNATGALTGTVPLAPTTPVAGTSVVSEVYEEVPVILPACEICGAAGTFVEIDHAIRGRCHLHMYMPEDDKPMPETRYADVSDKVARIKRLRAEVPSLSLKEAKDIVEAGNDTPLIAMQEMHDAAKIAADSVPQQDDPAADVKLAAAAQALEAASKLAATHEKTLDAITTILDRLHALDGRGSAGSPVASHGAGPIPGTEMVKAADLFHGVPASLMVPRFTERTQYTPEIDPDYIFDTATTTAILLGFANNRRILISGRHGTGKTSHVEQVAARLNWPFFRLNLDGHISRTDMIGRDAIVLEDGKQITQFKEGLLPWVMQQPMALCLDEYDAGRPDVLFVVQRLLEANGKLTIAEQNRIVSPHAGFRIFGTANTVGLGDASGLYHGTNAMNAAQMDRWSMTVKLDYLAEAHEIAILCAKVGGIGKDTAERMVRTATGTRQLFAANKISTVMSPRTVLTWAENTILVGNNPKIAFDLTFGNKCDEAEMSHIVTCYREAFRS